MKYDFLEKHKNKICLMRHFIFTIFKTFNVHHLKPANTILLELICNCKLHLCKRNINKLTEVRKQYQIVKDLTLRGLFCTISTASWLERCSQRPSEANMRNWSCGSSSWTVIDGSELNMGLLKGSRNRNFAYNGSLLYSGFLRYISPIDLEICKMN